MYLLWEGLGLLHGLLGDAGGLVLLGEWGGEPSTAARRVSLGDILASKFSPVSTRLSVKLSARWSKVSPFWCTVNESWWWTLRLSWWLVESSLLFDESILLLEESILLLSESIFSSFSILGSAGSLEELSTLVTMSGGSLLNGLGGASFLKGLDGASGILKYRER